MKRDALPLRLRWIGLLAVIGILALAPSAQAQGDSSDETYGGGGGNVQQAVEPGGTGDVSNPGALPFSGLDLVLMLGGAVVLCAAGAGVSRLASQRSAA